MKPQVSSYTLDWEFFRPVLRWMQRARAKFENNNKLFLYADFSGDEANIFMTNGHVLNQVHCENPTDQRFRFTLTPVELDDLLTDGGVWWYDDNKIAQFFAELVKDGKLRILEPWLNNGAVDDRWAPPPVENIAKLVNTGIEFSVDARELRRFVHLVGVFFDKMKRNFTKEQKKNKIIVFRLIDDARALEVWATTTGEVASRLGEMPVFDVRRHSEEYSLVRAFHLDTFKQALPPTNKIVSFEFVTNDILNQAMLYATKDFGGVPCKLRSFAMPARIIRAHGACRDAEWDGKQWVGIPLQLEEAML